MYGKMIRKAPNNR